MANVDKVADGIGNGLSFLWDNGKELAKSVGDVVLTTAANIGESAYNTIDGAGDALAFGTDLVNRSLNKATGGLVEKSHYSEGEGFLDKKGKEVAEGAKELEKLSDSKWTKDSRAMELFGDGVEHAADIFQIIGSGGAGLGLKAGGGLLKIGIKGATAPVTIPLNFIKSLGQTPKAAAEIKALFETAKAAGKVVSQPEVNAVIAKYASASIPKIVKGAEIGSKRMVSHLLKNVGPEDIAKLPPTIKAKILDGGGKLLSAELIDAGLDEDEIAQVEVAVGSKTEAKPEVKAEDKSTPAVDDSRITLPTTEKDFNPSKDSKFNVAPTTITPDTIDAKKKELQALKEKNAGTLNTSTSVVDLMKMLGADSTMEARKVLFEGLTSKPYQGTAEQNIQLKALVEEMFANGTLSDKIKSFKR